MQWYFEQSGETSCLFHLTFPSLLSFYLLGQTSSLPSFYVLGQICFYIWHVSLCFWRRFSQVGKSWWFYLLYKGQSSFSYPGSFKSYCCFNNLYVEARVEITHVWIFFAYKAWFKEYIAMTLFVLYINFLSQIFLKFSDNVFNRSLDSVLICLFALSSNVIIAIDQKI